MLKPQSNVEQIQNQKKQVDRNKQKYRYKLSSKNTSQRKKYLCKISVNLLATERGKQKTSKTKLNSIVLKQFLVPSGYKTINYKSQSFSCCVKGVVCHAVLNLFRNLQGSWKANMYSKKQTGKPYVTAAAITKERIYALIT